MPSPAEAPSAPTARRVPASLSASRAPATTPPPPAPPATEPPRPPSGGLRPRLWAAWALSLPALALATGDNLIAAFARPLPPGAADWLQFGLVTPVLLWCGAPLLRRASRSVRGLAPDAVALAVIAAFAAYLVSATVLVLGSYFPDTLGQSAPPPPAFHVAALLVAFALLGLRLEQRVLARPVAELRALLGLVPGEARVVHDDGAEEELPLASLRPGDRVRVRRGERLPADGRLLEPAAEIDESILTGDSFAALKSPGATLRAGTLNLRDTLLLRVERLGADTLLAQTARLVEQAVETETPAARLAARSGAGLVLAALLGAAASFVVWTWFVPGGGWARGYFGALAVLAAASPGALLLAAPAALAAAITRGARAGVLVKDPAALLAAARADTALFDKTGTLTVGSPLLVAIEPAADLSDVLGRHRPKLVLSPTDHLLRLAAAVEQASDHPVARAIVIAARSRGITLPPAEQFAAAAGVGACAVVEGRRVDLHRAPSATTLPGHPRATLIAATIDDRHAGLFAFSDPVRDSTPAALQELRALGLRLVMATGDRRAPALAVAEGLGLDDAHAELTPTDKRRVVGEHQARRARVLLAGDGVKDAPALAAADVGVAMGPGVDLAALRGGLVLVQGDLRSLARAVRLGRAVRGQLRQCLFGVLAYHAAALPLAAGLLLPLRDWRLDPLLAALAACLCMLGVVLGAGRLRETSL